MGSGIISEPSPAPWTYQGSLNTFSLSTSQSLQVGFLLPEAILSQIFFKFIFLLKPTLCTSFQMYLETLALAMCIIFSSCGITKDI